MTTNADLLRLYEKGILSELDVHFSDFIARVDGDIDDGLSLAAAIASSFTRQGHICVDLRSVAGKQLLEGGNGGSQIICPALKPWRRRLERSPVVGKPGVFRPLVLDDKSRLYLHRYWDYECQLARRISLRTGGVAQDIDRELLKDGLDRLFGKCFSHGFSARGDEIDWQRIAAFTSLVKRLCVISGGPGTGKTTTVAKILALILEQPSLRKSRIALAAPTGKAAARLQEAIRRSKKTLDCAAEIKGALPEEASTIHRLLGTVRGSPYFRHHANNTLPIDVLVVDEASMVDLALMSKLLQALSPDARLILLGDKDQLASVEAGAVLGDVCDTGNVHGFSAGFLKEIENATGCRLSVSAAQNSARQPAIADCIVELRKNYRFEGESGIGMISQLVNEGDGEGAIRALEAGRYKDISWVDLPNPGDVLRAMKTKITRGFSGYLRQKEIGAAFSCFDRFRVLCALREGPCGAIGMNGLVEKILKGEGLIEPEGTWYRGRPILIGSNDYDLHLFNGDIGILWPDPEADNDLRVFFPGADGTFRKFHPLRLPKHDTVYAMTVHKSQGSEFDRVLLLLPDKMYPVMTRELLYTGITRAKNHVEIWGVREVFQTAMASRIERMSGLRDALWGN
jgi:exodeoxyribonuclease V alpha subunit